MSDSPGMGAVLPAHVEAPVLGVPIVVRATSAAVIAAAERAFGLWRSLPAALVEPGPPGEVVIIVQALAPDEVALSGKVVTRSHAGALIAAGGGCLLCVQPASGSALAFIAPEVVADEPRLRREVLERLGLALAGARGRTPLPAGAVVWDGHALIFSGADALLNATLAVGCARAGGDLLAAGVVHLSAGRSPMLWGHPGTVRLPPVATYLFPDLPARAASGEASVLELDAAALGVERLATHAARATLCLVERTTGQASYLERLARDEALARLARSLAPDPAAVALLAALAGENACWLRVGADVGAAIALIGRLAAQGSLR